MRRGRKNFSTRPTMNRRPVLDGDAKSYWQSVGREDTVEGLREINSYSVVTFLSYPLSLSLPFPLSFIFGQSSISNPTLCCGGRQDEFIRVINTRLVSPYKLSRAFFPLFTRLSLSFSLPILTLRVVSPFCTKQMKMQNS